jgi:hypothetical protein
MRKVLVYSATAVASLVLAAAAYHVASPKVVLVNHSGTAFDELVVTLPSSRVSIGPVAPHSSDTIYFSRQASGGNATYSLHAANIAVEHGSFQYVASGQLFRVISVTIQADGTVTASVSG